MTAAYFAGGFALCLAMLAIWQGAEISVLRRVVRAEREAREKLVESNNHAIAAMVHAIEVMESFAPGSGRTPS